MHKFKKQLELQFFAEGAPAGEGGGEGAATGVEAAAAGQQARTLEELGVPKQKAEKYRARKSKAMPAAAAVNAAGNESNAEAKGQAAAAEAAAEEQKSKIPFAELMKDDEYNREMQKIVTTRLDDHKKRNGDAQAGLSAMTDIVEMLGKEYGIDTSDLSKVDFAALNKAFVEDPKRYKARAAEMGTDAETAMRMERLEREEQKRKRQEQESIRDQMAREHFDKLQQESVELKKLFPNFNLETEMQDKTFVRLTAPGSGLNLAQAYHALHYKEINEATAAAVARNAAQAMSNSIQSGEQRPRENGANSRGDAPVGEKLYSQMSPEERAKFKEQIKYNGARGVKTPLRF